MENIDTKALAEYLQVSERTIDLPFHTTRA